MKSSSLIVVILLGILVAGCTLSSRPSDERLSRVERLSDVDVAGARACLDSIDPVPLSGNDRHFYDFLNLKLNDKEYVQHTSDSLVLALIDYASRHHDAHYAETLYYGGRVYSDLGDYPSALHYFQEALDALPEKSRSTPLRSHILSQTGRLLDDLGLQSEAAGYVGQALAADRGRSDAVDEVYDLQLLGQIYLKSRQLDRADSCFRTALARSGAMSPANVAKTMVNLAAVQYQKEHYDSAIDLIRGMPEQVSPLVRDNANAYSAEIYYMAGIHDSAYAYARRLVDDPEAENREIGYHILLAPDMREYSSLDILNDYLYYYSQLLESYYDDNENRLALTQQAMYNYQLHEREKTKAEQSNQHLRLLIGIVVMLMLILSVVVLLWKNRVKTEMLTLRQTIAGLDRIRGNGAEISDSAGSSVHHLREQLKERLERLSADTENKLIPPGILGSEVYGRLQDAIKEQRTLRDDEDIWSALEEATLESSSKFRDNLILLTNGSLTEQEYRTALLIKCGCQPLQMATLLGRTKGAIVSRRDSISLKAFGRKLGTKAVDSIIRML